MNNGIPKKLQIRWMLHQMNPRTKNWVEIDDESKGIYNVNSQTKFKNTLLKSSLCDYSDAYILVKGTIAVNNTATADANEKIIMMLIILMKR